MRHNMTHHGPHFSTLYHSDHLIHMIISTFSTLVLSGRGGDRRRYVRQHPVRHQLAHGGQVLHQLGGDGLHHGGPLGGVLLTRSVWNEVWTEVWSEVWNDDDSLCDP